VLLRHNEALLGAAICDERLFDLLKDDLLIPTSKARFRFAVCASKIRYW
jgi:hypothetical protein